MAQSVFTKDEQTLLRDAIENAISSAQRQQTLKGRTPLIRQVYEQHEKLLRALQDKINTV